MQAQRAAAQHSREAQHGIGRCDKCRWLRCMVRASIDQDTCFLADPTTTAKQCKDQLCFPTDCLFGHVCCFPALSVYSLGDPFRSSPLLAHHSHCYQNKQSNAVIKITLYGGDTTMWLKVAMLGRERRKREAASETIAVSSCL